MRVSQVVLIQVQVEGQEVKASTCSCAIGRAKCHHVAALLIWAEKNLTRTDVECVWKRATTPKTDEVTAKRVSVIAPSTSQGQYINTLGVINHVCCFIIIEKS